MITAAKAKYANMCFLQSYIIGCAYNEETTPFYQIGLCAGCVDFSDLAAQDLRN